MIIAHFSNTVELAEEIEAKNAVEQAMKEGRLPSFLEEMFGTAKAVSEGIAAVGRVAESVDSTVEAVGAVVDVVETVVAAVAEVPSLVVPTVPTIPQV